MSKRMEPESPRASVSVAVTWTPDAQAALKKLEADGQVPQGARRRWNAALKLAARECASNVQARGEAAGWALRHAGVPWSIDATFVCDSEMRELNARFRGKDRPTDVLSFSQAESAPAEDVEVEEGEEEAMPEIQWPDASGGEEAEAALGDLVIAVETAQGQALERAHAGEAEVLFLSIHGTLHLLGYDHQTSAGRVAMWREQEALFERLRARVEKQRGVG